MKLVLWYGLIIIIILLCVYEQSKGIENANFSMDTLHVPENPVAYNEIEVRKFVRLIGIDKHLKLDKYGNVEKITFKKPEPELGESHCKRVSCPIWFKNVACWKCI